MKILSVDIQNLRNLSSVNLDLEAGHNLLVGDNGAGKTSVLEAVHLLGHLFDQVGVDGRELDGVSQPVELGISPC